jgi:hypothetical protein
MTQDNTKELLRVLKDYAVPDPAIVGKLPKGGMSLDFVGHADITRILIEIDPNWQWVPIAWDNGRPAIHVENGIATMWGELRILGQARLGVGSVRADKQELDKELVGDFLRNAAMRFGICLSLWTKQEWDDLGGTKTPAPGPKPRQTGGAAKTPAKTPQKPQDEAGGMLTDAQLGQFQKACAGKGIAPEIVAANAGVKWGEPIPASKLPDLRAAFKELSDLRDLAMDRAEEQAER